MSEQNRPGLKLQRNACVDIGGIPDPSGMEVNTARSPGVVPIALLGMTQEGQPIIADQSLGAIPGGGHYDC